MTTEGEARTRTIPDRIRPTPSGWGSPELEGMLITASEIQSRVRELADEIQSQLLVDKPIVILPVLSGSFLFAADLVRHWRFACELDFIGLSSYGASTQPGLIDWTHTMKTDIKDKHVLVIDDILDTGQTLGEVRKELIKHHPTAIHTCVLLNKTLKASGSTRFKADYTGFKIPDHFVVGYGLDFALKFRQLPFIGILSPLCHGTDAD